MKSSTRLAMRSTSRTISPAVWWVLGSPARWTIEYTAGPEGIRAGGLVRLTVPRFWGWSAGQTEYEGYPGYTIATTDARDYEVPHDATHIFLFNPFDEPIVMTVLERPIEPRAACHALFIQKYQVAVQHRMLRSDA